MATSQVKVVVWLGAAGKVSVMCWPPTATLKSMRLRLAGTVAPLSTTGAVFVATRPGTRSLA